MELSHSLSQITPALDGKKVRVAGWVHEKRDMGKLVFLVLREREGLAQLTIKKTEQPELAAIADTLIKETSVLAEGVVKKNPSVSAFGCEISPSTIEVLGRVVKQVPFELTGKVPADIDVRLDNRSVDLRRLETQATFKIRGELQKAFREKALELEFQEINTPTLLESASEGGTDVFEVKYFEKKAFLAQSPQLYKQLAVLGGMTRVFMTAPVFRAEKHNTTVHLNESTQMDIECAFIDDNQAISYLEEFFLHILRSVKKNCASQLKFLGAEYEVPERVPRFTYDEILEKLDKKGFKIDWGQDIPKEADSQLPKILGAEVFFTTRWPTLARAFYAMPLEENPKISKSYDLVFKGLEIASGAQRIHDPDVLVAQLKARNLNPGDFEWYVDAFRYGAVPHAGWSIGAERLCMKLANRANIRECALFPRDRNRLTP
ncbi:aspartate--tRNA(Asn) ligase [Candidatus Micrarchaeota archaeon]|nr:aspartate--tRNA(Asn) ligase [Candidatus Micrarchaeota archaeon]